MNTLQEVVIDEVRWPRMFAKLRRAGMYSSCGCAGCGSCQAAAQRFVRGLARGANPDGRYRATADGFRMPVYGRTLGDHRVDVLVDSRAEPTITDLAVIPEPIDDAWEGEGTKSSSCDRTWRWIWLTDSRNRQSPRNQRIANVALTVAAIANGWCGPANWTNFRRQVPAKTKGIYLIRWPDGAVEGAYLGRSHKGAGNIRGRLGLHYQYWRHFQLVATPGAPRPEDCKIYWLELAETTIEAVENASLLGILQAGGFPAGQARGIPQTLLQRQRAYRAMGFGNLDEIDARLSSAL